MAAIEQKRGTLRIIASAFKILAWACLTLGVIVAVFTIIVGTGPEGGPKSILDSFLLAFYGVIAFFLLYSWGEALVVLLDIETNTEVLRNLLRKKEQD